MAQERCKWSAPSLISEAILEKPQLGKPRAILFPATDDTSHAALLKQGRLELLNRYGLNSYPDFIDGKHALVISGYKDTNALFDALKNVNYISTPPHITGGNEPAPKLGLTEKIKQWRHGATLKAAGFAGIAGHALMATSGYIEHDPDKKRTALFLAVNSALYALYGNGVGDLNYTPILREMRENLAKNNIPVLPTAFDHADEAKEHQRSLLLKGQDVVRSHVIEINEGIGLASQLMIMRSGLGGHESGTRSIPFFLAGLTSAIGNGVAIFVPEKKKKDQNPALQHSIWGRAVSWMQEAPLRFLGYTTFIQNGLFFWDVYKKREMYGSIAAKEHSGAPDSHSAQIQKIKNDMQTEMQALGRQPVSAAKDVGAVMDRTRDIRARGIKLRQLENELRLSKIGNRVWAVPLAMGTLYTLATFLMTITYKNRADSVSPEKMHQEVFARAALTALQIPEGKKREDAILLMGTSLHANHEIEGLPALKISDHIRSRVTALASSPWRDDFVADDQIKTASPEQDQKMSTKDSPSTVVSGATAAKPPYFPLQAKHTVI